MGRQSVHMPQRRPCDTDEVRREVDRINPPFCVHPTDGAPFMIRRRVFLEAEDLRVECEDEGELRLACRLVAEDHSRWQQSDDTHALVQETRRMEDNAHLRREEEDADDDPRAPCEEEDITLEEWSQLGYKWFKKDDMVYI